MCLHSGPFRDLLIKSFFPKYSRQTHQPLVTSISPEDNLGPRSKAWQIINKNKLPFGYSFYIKKKEFFLLKNSLLQKYRILVADERRL